MRILFILVMGFSIFKSDDTGIKKECYNIIRKYNIIVNLKSINGWKRVCGNDKIELYTKPVVGKYAKYKLCECIISTSNEKTDRSIEIFKLNVK